MFNRFIFSIIGVLFPLFVAAHDGDFNCYSIVAGCKATVDGSVMLAHNEDDGGEQLLNFYRVPTQQHEAGDYWTFRNGGREQLPAKTKGYLWLELVKMDVSDSYLNDSGVAVVSDGCPSKEDRKDFTDGGVVYELRQMVAQQATSARHAVDHIGYLVEKYGYASSGRTYCVADAKEAWAVAVVQGRHWMAQRIPDNHVMALPNSYTIDRIDLNDKQNFAGSADIISYATERGWYDPAKDGVFSFRKAYASKGSYDHIDNIDRAWVPVCALTGKKYEKSNLPFSFEPAKKVSLSAMMDILSSHYREKPWKRQRKDTLHDTRGSICMSNTQYGAVFQLRSNMPVEIGSVVWVAPYHPCMQVFVPWYLGMNNVPHEYARYDSYATAMANHFTDVEKFREKNPDMAYWKYVDSSERIKKDYKNNIREVKPQRDRYQKELLDQQSTFETKMIDMYQTDKEQCQTELAEYTAKWLETTIIK